MKYKTLLLSVILGFLSPFTYAAGDSEIGVSLWVSKDFVQTFLTAEHHGQNVSKEKDQKFGFRDSKIEIKDQRILVKTNFWYEHALTGHLAGLLTTSFAMDYIAKRKRVMFVDGTVDDVDFKESPGLLRPVLVFAMETALNRVAVTSKLKTLSLGENVKVPIQSVQVHIQDEGVLSSVNQDAFIPEALQKEMFAISMSTDSANAAIQHMAPEIFVSQSVSGKQKGKSVEVALDGKPYFELQADKAHHIEAMWLIFNLSLKSSDQKPVIVQIRQEIQPYIEGVDQEVSIYLPSTENRSIAALSGSKADHAGEVYQHVLGQYLKKLDTKLQQLKLALPPVQFIPSKQKLQQSQKHYQNEVISFSGILVSKQ